MKERITKRIAELKKVLEKQNGDISKFTQATENCIAQANKTVGAIRELELLLKEEPKKDA